MPPKQPALDTILSLAKKPGVTIYIDGDTDSQEANMGAKYTYAKKDKILTITISILTEKEKEGLLPVIRQYFDETGLLLKDSQEQIIESYSKYAAKRTDKKTLEFFREILPPDDFNALKMSLFMRSEKEKGVSIDSYKKDIRERFGARGANIANLCNAGYFENEFMPIYNQSSPEEFNRTYELAVGKKARALFVHSGMTQQTMQELFNIMIEKARKYHMSDFRIHGFGVQNVSLIKEFLNNRIVDEDEDFNIIKRDEVLIPAAIEYDVVFFRQ